MGSATGKDLDFDRREASFLIDFSLVSFGPKLSKQCCETNYMRTWTEWFTAAGHGLHCIQIGWYAAYSTPCLVRGCECERGKAAREDVPWAGHCRSLHDRLGAAFGGDPLLWQPWDILAGHPATRGVDDDDFHGC